MKLFFNIMKILAALAVVAGIVYVAFKYGDKIVAWVKKTLKLDCFCDDCDCDEDCCYEDDFCAAEAVEVSEDAPVHAEENDIEG